MQMFLILIAALKSQTIIPVSPHPNPTKDDISVRYTPASAGGVEVCSGKLGNDNICFRTREFVKKPHFKMSEFLALCQHLLGTNNIGPYWHTLVGFPIN